MRLALLIVGLTAGAAWLAQRVELVYNGPYLAGAGSQPGGQVFLAVPLAALAAAALFRRLLGPRGPGRPLRRSRRRRLGHRLGDDAPAS